MIKTNASPVLRGLPISVIDTNIHLTFVNLCLPTSQEFHLHPRPGVWGPAALQITQLPSLRIG